MTTPKPFVFVLMPFSSSFDDIYKLGIKPACENAGSYAERVDEQIFDERILDRIYNQISKVDLIVSEMTGRNPNVFYETGYAHALGKTVILITQKASDIPFDLKHFPHIIYDGRIADLIPELEKRVRWALERPGSRGVVPSNLQVYYDRKFFFVAETVIEVYGPSSRIGFSMSFDIHNAEETTQETAIFEYSIISPSKFIRSKASGTRNDPSFTVIGLPDGRNLHLPQIEYRVLPQSWQKIHFWILTNNESITDGDEIELTLRLHTEHGIKDIPFKVRYKIV